ncbi:Na(+)/H(+) antiporter NhaA, partial [Streptomyces halstedii]
LIGELAFAGDEDTVNEIKAAVLIGSLIAAALSSVLLRLRVRRYRALSEEEELDEDASGVPDVYEQDDPEYHRRMAAIHEEKAAEHRRLAEEAGAARSKPDSPA